MYQFNYPVILGSSSRYRRELLSRLKFEFECHSPDIDETPNPNELPKDLAQRLSAEKADFLQKKFPSHILICGDQVCGLGDICINKPETYEGGVAQLLQLSGKKAIFYSAMTVIIPNELPINYCAETSVEYQDLSLKFIQKYLEIEPAYDCAGSAWCEGLGIAVTKAIRSDDPTAVIGLPLIKLTEILNKINVYFE